MGSNCRRTFLAIGNIFVTIALENLILNRKLDTQKVHKVCKISLRLVATLLLNSTNTVASQFFFSLQYLQSFTKYLRQTLVFMRNSEMRESFSFCLLAVFLLVSTKFSFWDGDWALGYNSMRFRSFPDLS